MAYRYSQEGVYARVWAWEEEEDYRRRGDLVLELQDIADNQPEFADEIRAAGVPGV